MKKEFQQASELFIDPLDQLLNEALREQSKKSIRMKASPSKEDKPLLPELKLTSGFYDQSNWKQVRTISLIHQPSATLLGNFNEFQYVHNIKTRRLVRVNEPTSTDGTEFVTGDWWLQQETERHQDPTKWIESRSAVIGITLTECGLHCDAAEVVVRLEYGYIARVELATDTRFTSPARNTFLIIPKGIDVQECMSLDSRLALKSELHIGEE